MAKKRKTRKDKENPKNYKQPTKQYENRNTDVVLKKARKKPGKGWAVLLVIVLVAAGIYGGVQYSKYTGYRFLNPSNYIELAKYEKKTCEPIDVKVTDAQVKSKIDSALAATATTETVKTGKVADGDKVNIDYAGKINGKAFDGGTASSQDLTIGSGAMIPGFEDGIKGKEVGSTFDINVTFPKDYNSKEVAGKKAVFTITVNSKEVTTTPELDDKWVAANSDYKTVKEYKAGVKANLKKYATKSAKVQSAETMLADVIKDTKVTKWPMKQYKVEKKAIDDMYNSMAGQYGMDMNTFMVSYLGCADEAAYKTKLKEDAREATKKNLVIRAIAKQEGIKYSKKQYNEDLHDMIDQYGYTEESFKKAIGQSIEEYAEANNLYVSMYNDYAETQIYDKYVKTDKKSGDKSKK